MIPMPPSHVVSWRQNAIECDERVDVGQHARAGRREAGHRLEVGVDRALELRLVGEHVRNRADSGDEQPDERDHEVALARADALLAARGQLEREADGERDDAAGHERPADLAVADRDGGRHEERGREVAEERADEVERGGDVDADRLAAHGPPEPRPRDHSARSTSVARDDSVKTITRSPGTQHVVAVREDRLAVADDRADQRARHRQLAERPVRRARSPPAR